MREIIGRNNWTLYEQSNPGERPFSWEELEKRGPSLEYEIGKNYIFAPIPKHGQSLREAYSIPKGFGPSLLVEDSDDERWRYLSIDRECYERGQPIIFTRLFFHEQCLSAFSPTSSLVPDSDDLGIKYSHVIGTFEKYFRIVSPHEYGIPIPVEMPIIPEDN